jgi:hypothetical protein
LDRIVSSAPDSVQPIRRSIPRRARCRGGVHPGIRSPAAEGDESRCDWRRICPDASACPALLSTARLYGDRYRSNLWDHINALAAEPDNNGYRSSGG